MLNHAATPAIVSAVINVKIPNIICLYLPYCTSTATIKHSVNINICMIYIEKLHNDKEYEPRTWYTPKQPTLIDLFYECDIFGFNIMGKLQMAGLDIGTKHGIEGCSVTEVLRNKTQDNIIWEIDAVTFATLSRVNQVQLLERQNLIICDYTEGGFHIHKTLNHKILKYAKNLMISTSGMESYDHIPGVKASLQIPVFALITHKETVLSNNMPAKPSADTIRTRKVLAPAHKPRLPRLQMLAELDRAGILKDTDWSLVINFDEDGERGDFLTSPNTSFKRFQNEIEHNDVMQFVESKRHLLPKQLDDHVITRFEECIPLNKSYAGKYAWYIGMETYRFIKFPTEKTFKGMIAGLPVLTMAPPDFNYELEGLGFRMPFREEYDYIQMGKERAEAIVEIINEKSVSMEILEHNYNLMSSAVFLSNLVVKPLLYWIMNHR